MDGFLFIMRRTHGRFSVGIIPAELDQSDDSEFAWWTLEYLSGLAAASGLLEEPLFLPLIHAGSIGELIPVKKNDRVKVLGGRIETVLLFLENYGDLYMPDRLIFYPFLKN